VVLLACAAQTVQSSSAVKLLRKMSPQTLCLARSSGRLRLGRSAHYLHSADFALSAAWPRMPSLRVGADVSTARPQGRRMRPPPLMPASSPAAASGVVVAADAKSKSTLKRRLSVCFIACKATVLTRRPRHPRPYPRTVLVYIPTQIPYPRIILTLKGCWGQSLGQAQLA
jgi:hypothetical protein